MVNFLILFIILKKFVFTPLGDFLDTRQKTIANSLKEAEESKQKAENLLTQQQKSIAKARQEIKAMRESAEDSIRKEQQNSLNETKKESERLLDNAQKEIKLGYSQAKQHLISEVGSLSLELAKNILKRDMNSSDQQKVVSEYLDKLKV